MEVDELNLGLNLLLQLALGPGFVLVLLLPGLSFPSPGHVISTLLTSPSRSLLAFSLAGPLHHIDIDTHLIFYHPGTRKPR